MPLAIDHLRPPSVLALTATASPEVAEDIVRQLQLEDVAVVYTSIYRKNLRYELEAVQDESDRQRLLVDILRETEGTGIVYTRTSSRLRYGHRQGRYSLRHPPRDAWVTRRLLPGVRPRRSRWRTGAWVLLYQRADQRTHIFFMAGRYPPLQRHRHRLRHPRASGRAQPSGDARCHSSRSVRRSQAKSASFVPAQRIGGSSGSIVSLGSRLSRGSPAATAIGTSSSG